MIRNKTLRSRPARADRPAGSAGAALGWLPSGGRGVVLAVILAAAGPVGAAAQALPELVAEARASSPEVEAARRTADAAAARIPRAGALPDPMLSVGLMNVPVAGLDLSREGMTMGSVELGQRFPAPGTRSAREVIATQAHRAAELEAEEVALGVITRLKSAYYELLFVEGAVEVLRRNHALVADLAEVARARYAVGGAPQQDVLRAQTEVTRIEEQISGMEARRVRAIADINALLVRPPATPIQPVFPDDVHVLALSAPPPGAFMAAALEEGMGDGFPSLAELQEAAVERRPMFLAHVQRIGAARAGVRLATRERFPDVDVMLGYGTRWGRDDMMTAMVSLPIPVFAARKQSQAVVEAEHALAAEELRHHQMVADLEADIAARYTALARTREQVLLLNEGVIPQARATIESAMAAYQAGTVQFASLLEAQATLFRNDIDLARRMADFGRELAALERAVGMDLSGEAHDDDR